MIPDLIFRHQVNLFLPLVLLVALAAAAFAERKAASSRQRWIGRIVLAAVVALILLVPDGPGLLLWERTVRF